MTYDRAQIERDVAEAKALHNQALKSGWSYEPCLSG